MRDQIRTRSAVAKEVALAAHKLPQEIWWEVIQVLTSQSDFGSLFLCAQVSQGLAICALPALYSIHELTPAGVIQILNLEPSVVLWRSIIASALGKTLYPYCTWIKTLKLSSLFTLLEDIARGKGELRNLFFKHPLHNLQILKGKSLDFNAIIIEVANQVTQSIHAAAEDENKFVGLASLEGPHLPSHSLSTWVSRLSRLTSLAVRDGFVLNGKVAQAIRENCPLFKEV